MHLTQYSMRTVGLVPRVVVVVVVVERALVVVVLAPPLALLLAAHPPFRRGTVLFESSLLLILATSVRATHAASASTAPVVRLSSGARIGVMMEERDDELHYRERR